MASKPNNMDEKDPQQQQINIELPEDMAEGIYSNLAIISHSQQEFVIDYIRVMPGVPKAKVKARIVVTPEHAKRLMKALSKHMNIQSVANFQKKKRTQKKWKR